jgi:hypothetical protein
MTVAQTKAARRKIMAHYGKKGKSRSVHDAIYNERKKAERETKAKGKKK